MQRAIAAQDDSLLIAMSNTKASLKMVRTVSASLTDPRHTHVTLMHYLMPIYWEHGGELSNDRELQEVLREEEQALRIEERQKKSSRDYFQEARMTLEKAGVPAENIQTRLTSDGVDIAHAVLHEVEDGDYKTVVVGEHHRAFLEQLFNRSIADFLKKHARGIDIWHVPQPQDRQADTVVS